MAKQGMKRPEPERKKNEVLPVPEIGGKAERSASHPNTELGMENLMNDFDMTAADIQDFWRKW